MCSSVGSCKHLLTGKEECPVVIRDDEANSQTLEGLLSGLPF